MELDKYDTLMIAVDHLTKKGYTEDFKAGKKVITGLYSKKEYNPDDLTIVKTFRFDGMTNPEDDVELFAIKAKDGTLGTLVLSYSAEHDQNVELIKAIKFQK